jgi:uncharacterized protein YqeY
VWKDDAMTIMERISQDMTKAMKARDSQRLGALRMAKAALMNREVEKGRALDAAEEQQVMVSLIKQRRDSIEQFRKGGREDLVEKETAEIAALEGYLPPPVDPGDIDRAITEAIAETGATSARDLGKVMKAVMPKLAGQAVDGRTINEQVRKKLGA